MPPAPPPIVDRIAAALPQSGRVAIPELLGAASSTPVRGFLEIEMDTAFGSDTEPIKAHFDLPDELDTATYQLLQASIRNSATVSVVDARKILDKAVRETTEYLTRPRSYLEALFSTDDQVLLDALFFRTLDRITDYTYFPDVLRLWAERLCAEGINRVSRKQFADMLSRIDRGLIAHYGLDQIEELLVPLAILFNGPIPRQTLVEFFRDKSMHRVAARIASIGMTSFSVNDVKQVLHNVHNSTTPGAAGIDREQLSAELRAAGVVLGRERESALLSDITSRESSASA